MIDEKRIKRLHYLSWYRGCKETDKILGGFARAHLEELKPAELDEFERILGEDDSDLFDWMTGKRPMPEHYQQSPLMQRILAFDVTSLWCA